ncbi:hypothetical protein K502DRAFT_264624 [Neoconidiobolus thromboides FSU 785]|nr:hypothetical protein K502DRAFT_264624 [Neoconidiobolus thromboides FSU 785]
MPPYEYPTTIEDYDEVEPEFEERGEESAVQLGFIDNSNEKRVEYGAFLTKLGGFPVWLCPDKSPSAADLNCGVCSKPLSFLLQIYTPEDDPPEAYHRVLYVFICKANKCLKANRKTSIKVIRSQLPRENKYYVLDEDKSKYIDGEEDEEFYEEEEFWKLKDDVKVENQCWVCHLQGDKRCSKCHLAQYCSKEHQVWDWTIGSHKHNCDKITKENIEEYKQKVNRVGFPEKYIDSEPEKSIEEMKKETMKKVEKLMEEVTVNKAPEEGDSKALVVPGDEKYENTKVEVDAAFLAFQRRVEFDPTQVIRYVRTYNKDEEGQDIEPLWVGEQGKPTPSDILPCQKCYSPRVFELQIMPQLLNYLPLDNSSFDSMDWGSYFIYSCPNSCWPAEEGSLDYLSNEYVYEVAFHQDFSEDGIGENIRKNHFE